MLVKRIIPCLDVSNGRVVKGVNFVNLTDVGDPVRLAKYYWETGADELVFLDIAATPSGKNIMLEFVEKVAQNIFIPFSVGGGIRNLEDMREVLRAGADKVSINSAAVDDPSLISEARDRFGSQCVVVAIDVKKTESSKWEVFVSGGRKPTGLDAIEWAQQVAAMGAGEILLTSMDRDGTNSGFDIELYQEIGSKVKIPIIASGGGGTAEDFLFLFQNTNIDAALAASIFHYRRMTVSSLKDFLIRHSIPIRPISRKGVRIK